MRGETYFIDETKLHPGAPIGPLVDFLKADRLAADHREARLRRELTASQQHYREQRTRLLGAETIGQLQAYALQHTPPNEPRLVTPGQLLRERRQRLEESRQFAHGLRVNLEALSRLNQQARTDAQRLLPGESSALGAVDVKMLDQALAPAPLDYENPLKNLPVPPPLTPFGGSFGVAQSAPYAWWDRGGLTYEFGDGRILRNDSRLNGDTGVSGSCVWYRNKNASDYDHVIGTRETGFLVPYVPSAAGPLNIQFNVTCLFSQHCMETYNEWGWSDYGAFTQERFRMGILWKWEDDVPATESDVLIGGTNGSGNGNSSPGVQYPVSAGEIRTVTLTSQIPFPANVPVWIYAGTLQRVYADLNDVSLNTFVNSIWQFSQIRIGQA